MEEFLGDWGYLGIFVGLIATGAGFPMPEELPVVMGGALAGSHPDIRWWIMLPVCIVGVIVGDACLYSIGRFWGPMLLRHDWVKRRVFPPDRLAAIERNFQKYGVKILLFARLTPGVRSPVFFTAGLTKLSIAQFILADGIYAIPGVSLLFFLGYWFTGSMIDFIKGPFEQLKSVLVIVVIVLVIGYVVYRMLRKPTVTGDPKDMPPLVEQVTHRLEQVTNKIMHPKSGHHAPSTEHAPPAPGVDGQPQPIHPPVQPEDSNAPGQRT